MNDISKIAELLECDVAEALCLAADALSAEPTTLEADCCNRRGYLRVLIAKILLVIGDAETARVFADEALGLYERLFGAESTQLVGVLSVLAEAQEKSQDAAASETRARIASILKTAQFGVNHESN